MNAMTGNHFHTQSLRAFEQDLAVAGFEPVTANSPSHWRGPIHPAFESLTKAATMDIVIKDGWPYEPPALLVDGLDTNHSTLGGLVCMWQDGDASLEWTTVEGFMARIEAWCENAKHDWQDDHLGYDAFLNFDPCRKELTVATFNLQELGVRRRSWGDAYGIVNKDPFRINIVKSRPQSGHWLSGHWFHVGTLNTPPPREFAEVFRYLPRPQKKALRRATNSRRDPRPFVASGGADFILLCWERRSRTDLLVMVCTGIGNEVAAIAVQPGPTDEESLILRAGPDAVLLRDRKATVLGAGALGSHVAVTLAESGIGFLDIVDHDFLLPGNVVRHAAGRDEIGRPKADAVRRMIEHHAPWTVVGTFVERTTTPIKMHKRIASADIVIDTTGNDAFVPGLAMVAQETGVPLVSGALHRGGKIARVQRQARPADAAIHTREHEPRYPVIPDSDEAGDNAVPALGCSAPVNNAPPASVLACAALIAQVALDTLTRRFEFEDEVIDVYQPISEHPFDRIGRVIRCHE